MNVLLFGATGMLGQAALRECLLDADVHKVTAITRTSLGKADPKLREVVVPDLFDVSRYAEALDDIDACLFCLGVSSAGKSEADYRHVTYDLTLAVGRELAARSPRATFVYITGAGTDSTANGRTMWARVKGETENALLALPLRAAYMFRPGYIHAMNGETSRTPFYSVAMLAFRPLYPVLKAVFPKWVTDTERLSRALVIAGKRGAPKQVLEVPDINALAS